MHFNRIRSFRALPVLMAAALFALTTIARPVPVVAQAAGAQLSVVGTGTVRVDGNAAATGATVFSGNKVSTDENSSAVLTLGGTRVTLNPRTDATVTFMATSMMVDISCGSVSSVPGAGASVETITRGATNVYNQTGALQVQAEGRTFALVANQTQGFNGEVRATASGPSSFEVSTTLCQCVPAAPIAPPPATTAGAFPIGLLLAIIGAGAATATIIPIALDDDSQQVVVSRAFPG